MRGSKRHDDILRDIIYFEVYVNTTFDILFDESVIKIHHKPRNMSGRLKQRK